MNKIAIVGHPASGYREVESLLHQCGMQPARPSKREGLSPQEISDTLCRAHEAPVIEQVVAEEEVQQVQAGAVWHGMALDLMLGNLDQPLWGWADPQAIFLLEYWERLDPKLSFVLVYDEPHRVLLEAAGADEEPATSEDMERLLSNWVAYNGALLSFYLRNPERCLLVHSQQVRRAAGSYLRQLQPLVGSSLLRVPATVGAGSLEVDDDSTAADVMATAPVPIALPRAIADAVASVGIELQDAEGILATGAAERYLVDSVLAEHPAALQLYAELQSSANLPLGRPAREMGDPKSAWRALVHQRAFVSELVSRLHAEHARRIMQAGQQAEAEISSLQGEASRLANELTQRDVRMRESAEESELLLTQLHQVQEELERQHLQEKKLEERIAQKDSEAQRQAEQLTSQVAAAKAAMEAALASSARKEEELKAAREKVEADLNAERAKAEAEASAAAERARQARELGEENELLLAQLHQVQEELERYFLEREQLKKQLPKPVPKPPGPRGAADRVKRQLSYRLGAAMVQRSRSLGGWVSMPWALVAEARAFRIERAAGAGEALPPLHSYVDAHEAERVKQHLSYRLGETLIACGKTPLGWFKLPVALAREVREFRMQRREA